VQGGRSLRSRWPSRCEGRLPPLRSWRQWGRPLRARLPARCAGGLTGHLMQLVGHSVRELRERGALPAGPLRSPA
ncbi:hypothetical protein, partial [Streptomyces brevispora]|uniref:hypothetical protein n=1 Tax=Streptomyces brevispora TaxID=887462 RepID=UPI0035DE9D88